MMIAKPQDRGRPRKFLSRWEWRIGGALAALVILSGVVAIVMAWDQICLFYYATLGIARELPSGRIRPAYRWVVHYEMPFEPGRDLPEKADNLRAILWGRGASSIFLRFETDANGIAQIVEVFDRPGADSELMSEVTLRAAKEGEVHPFPRLPSLEEKLGVSLFDRRSIDVESCRLLDNRPERYTVLIDHGNRTVYMRLGP